MVATLLLIGVTLSALAVTFGGTLYLYRQGAQVAIVLSVLIFSVISGSGHGV